MKETTAMDPADDLRPEVLKAAADWFALLACSEPQAETHRRWQDWFDADAMHRDAWARVEKISRQFDLPADTRAAVSKALDRSTQQLRQRRQFMKGLLGVGGVCALGGSLSHTESVQHAIAGLRADYRTGVGETREVLLPEGSHIWMNTASAMNVHFDAASRILDLKFGELAIETAADVMTPPRAFIVRTAIATLRALGTHFNVRQLDDSVQLDVFNGRVELQLHGAAETPRIIDAGQQVELTSKGIGQPHAASLAREAWTRGVLLADDVSLGSFLDELARYCHGMLFCDPAVTSLRVVGGYPLADPDRVLSMLEAALPIRVTRRSHWWINVGPR